MNIFILDADVAASARYHQDAHIGKMPLEGCQLLSTCHPADVAPYRHTHVNHPCALWVRSGVGNYHELVRRTGALLNESAYRGHGFSENVARALHVLRDLYGPVRITGNVDPDCVKVQVQVGNQWRRLPVVSGDSQLSPFAQAMPEQYRGPDAVAAYRAYYVAEKQGHWRKVHTKRGLRLRWLPATWTRRDPPPWWRWLPLPERPTAEQMQKLGLTTLDGVEIVVPLASELQAVKP